VSSNTQPMSNNTPTQPQSPSPQITPSYPQIEPTANTKSPENMDTPLSSPPTQLLQMVTKAHNHISKPKNYTEGTILYPIA
jgi:hypothetical protein